MCRDCDYNELYGELPPSVIDIPEPTSENVFIYTQEELDILGTPGFDSDRDQADAWNRKQLAKLATENSLL